MQASIREQSNNEMQRGGLEALGFSCSALFLNLSLHPLLARLETSTDCKLMAHTRLKGATFICMP
jgi:hypothetical protein